MENPKNPLEEILEHLLKTPKVAKLQEFVSSANSYQDEYHANIKQMLNEKNIPEGIVVLGKMLYDLTLSQEKLSEELCAISLSVSSPEEFEKEKDRVSVLSSELVRAYLRLVVLTHALQLGSGQSATELIDNHAMYNIPLNLDNDVEKN